MNTYVTIKHVVDYKKVSYYSICLEGEEDSIFETFVKKFSQVDISSTTKEELAIILAWLQTIGNEKGAKDKYFRHEGTISDAKALPPPAKFIEGDAGDLRLYCMVCNQHVVFLYNGHIKTTNKAQDCPNVAPYLRLANKLTKAINQAFIDKDIRWDDMDEDILYEDDFELVI